MVGWAGRSRRHRESRERAARYRAWFATLSPEDKAKVRAREAEAQRQANVMMAAALFVLVMTGIVVSLLSRYN